MTHTLQISQLEQKAERGCDDERAQRYHVRPQPTSEHTRSFDPAVKATRVTQLFVASPHDETRFTGFGGGQIARANSAASAVGRLRQAPQVSSTRANRGEDARGGSRPSDELSRRSEQGERELGVDALDGRPGYAVLAQEIADHHAAGVDRQAGRPVQHPNHKAEQSQWPDVANNVGKVAADDQRDYRHEADEIDDHREHPGESGPERYGFVHAAMLSEINALSEISAISGILGRTDVSQ